MLAEKRTVTCTRLAHRNPSDGDPVRRRWCGGGWLCPAFAPRLGGTPPLCGRVHGPTRHEVPQRGVAPECWQHHNPTASARRLAKTVHVWECLPEARPAMPQWAPDNEAAWNAYFHVHANWTSSTTAALAPPSPKNKNNEVRHRWWGAPGRTHPSSSTS
jgi:hypothetical protein